MSLRRVAPPCVISRHLAKLARAEGIDISLCTIREPLSMPEPVQEFCPTDYRRRGKGERKRNKANRWK